MALTFDTRRLTVACADGYRLGVVAFEPRRANDRVALIATAAAVPCRYYFDFAEFLAAHGVTVVTWDWRGIGESRPDGLRGFAASMRDWGSRDLPAVIDWVSGNYGQPVIGIGHSFGGQSFGLADRAGRISRLLLVGTQSGYWRHWPVPHRYAFAAVLNVLPAVTRLFGYLPAKTLGLGEDLPRNVALEWFDWCRSPDYMGTYEGHQAIRAPVLSLGASDDGYAPEAARRWMLERYGGAERYFETVAPVDGPIGHFGYFRKRHRELLWERKLRWILGDAPRN